MRNSGATLRENRVDTNKISGTGKSVSSASSGLITNSITATPSTMSKELTKSGSACATSTSIWRVSFTVRLNSSPVCLSLK